MRRERFANHRARDRLDALEDAAWAAHCWIVDASLTGALTRMPPADISVAISDAIRDAKPRPTIKRECCEY